MLVEDEPALYVERGGRGLVTLGELAGVGAARRCAARMRPGAGLAALAEAVRGGRVRKLALERIDGEPAIASELAETLIELGFHSGRAGSPSRA